MAEISRCHTFTKKINRTKVRSQYFIGYFYSKNCLRVFSAMTKKLALPFIPKCKSQFVVREFASDIYFLLANTDCRATESLCRASKIVSCILEQLLHRYHKIMALCNLCNDVITDN